MAFIAYVSLNQEHDLFIFIVLTVWTVFDMQLWIKLRIIIRTKSVRFSFSPFLSLSTFFSFSQLLCTHFKISQLRRMAMSTVTKEVFSFLFGPKVFRISSWSLILSISLALCVHFYLIKRRDTMKEREKLHYSLCLSVILC